MSASLISLIMTILFIVVVLSGFLIGMWRGLKRSVVSLVISIVGVVISFFITPLISNAVLSISINVNGTSGSIHEMLLNMILSIEEVGSLVDKNPNLQTFFLNLPKALVNVVLFLIISLIIQAIFYIIYKILAVVKFKVDPEKKKHKLAGGIVGAVKTLLVVLFAFMPLASLIGVANTCTTSGDYGINQTAQVRTLDEETKDKNENGMIASLLPETATNIIDGLENNLLTKMSGMFGLDDAMFDYYGSFEVAGEKLSIREEVVNVYNVVDLSYQLSYIDESCNFQNFNYTKISNNISKLSSSPMFKNILADTIGELIINYKDYSFIADSQFVKDNEEIVEAISLGLKAYTEAGGSVSDYFTDDIMTLVEVAMTFGQRGIIDEITALEEINADNIIIVITEDENSSINYHTTKNALTKLFKMNIVRDAIEEISKKVVEQLSEEVDPIGVSTGEWNDNDWDSLSNSISSVLKKYGDIAENVNIMEVLEDATILLDETKNYDIAGILSDIGTLIDEARNVNLLQTSDNKPIIDKLLNSNNIPLPNSEQVIAEVVANDGNTKTIKTHKELFEFISPSLVTLRDKNVYKTITAEGETDEKLISLAQIISEDGNKDILSDIILPLYQVEQTKSLIVSQVSKGLKSDLIDLSTLSNYEEWKIDLSNISSLLKILNEKSVSISSGGSTENKTFLQLALDDKLNTIIDNLEDEDVENIIKPAMQSKSTAGLKTKILTKISTDLALFTRDTSLALSAVGVTFIEGHAQDQTQEFCNVLKTFLPLKDAYVAVLADLKQVDKTLLANTLSAMQTNAYRTILASKTEEGIFKDAFISLMSEFKSEYATEIAVLESDPDMLEEELGIRSFAEDNYSKIDFAKLMTLLASLEA